MADASIVSRIAHEVYEHQPSTMPDGRWWEFLQTNFHRRPEAFELDRRDQLQVGATALFDVGLRTALGSVMTLVGLRHALSLRAVQRDFVDAALYTELVDAGQGRAFYPEAPPGISVQERRARGPHFRPVGGECVDLAWDSPFEPYNGRLREPYLAQRHNARAHVRMWRHHGPPRPTLVVVHGFIADAHLFNEWLFQLRWYYEKLGLDIASFTLPFHGPRRGQGTLFTGQMFFSRGLSWIAEIFRQTVLDFRILLDHLTSRGSPAAGVTGISLGGYTTALLASLEPRLAFAVPNVPVVSMPDLVLEWNPVGTISKAAMFAADVSLKRLRHMTAIHCALSYEPALPRERLMIVGGVGDRLAPPKHARLLWDHWRRPAIHWFPGNHIMHLDQGAYLRQIARFLGGLDFLP